MDLFLYIFLIAFAGGVGFFLGSGNRRGLQGSLLPGLIPGVIISFHFWTDAMYLPAALMIVSAVVGSIVSSLTPDSNRLKRLSREQSGLNIKVGSYRLGRKA
jgi:hypothetical protein